jgi:hypothetical protein
MQCFQQSLLLVAHKKGSIAVPATTVLQFGTMESQFNGTTNM